MIDILRTSASRPALLKVSTESVLKNLKYSGKINWFLHEDVLNKTASEECVAYSKSLNLYNKIEVSDPAIGQHKSFIQLTKHITSKYMIHYEDDYELLKELDLDTLINIMEKYPDSINQITFPKRDILPDRPNFVKREIELDGIKFTTAPHWFVQPALWRMSFISPYMQKVYSYNDMNKDWHWVLSRALRKNETITDGQWVIDNSKTFYLGEMRKGKIVEHIGTKDNSLRLGKFTWSTT
jgi:hypothetical protein